MSICSPLRRGLLSHFWTPASEQLRFRNRPNLRKPLPLHYKRARALRVCEPILPPSPKFCQKYEEISMHQDKTEENPYAQFLAKEMRKNFYNAQMVAIFHENIFIMHEFLRIRGMFFDAKFDIHFRYNVNKKVGKMALLGTKFEPVLQLLRGHTMIGYCNSKDVSTFLKLTKKMPDFILLGLLIDDHLLHKNDYEAYAKLGSIDTARGHLYNTLSSVSGQQLSSSLVSNIHALSHSLTALSQNQINSNSDSGTTTTAEETTPPPPKAS